MVLKQFLIPDIGSERIGRPSRHVAIILNKDVPRFASLVRKSERNEWPESRAGSKPPRSACALTMLAIDRSVSSWAWTWPPYWIGEDWPVGDLCGL
jgi:hypothetical protein